MAEYIDREELRKILETWRDAHADDVLRELNAQDTADVAPVVHGTWTIIGADKRGRGGIWRCSACDGCQPYKSDYCPNCGAKMDGGAE